MITMEFKESGRNRRGGDREVVGKTGRKSQGGIYTTGEVIKGIKPPGKSDSK